MARPSNYSPELRARAVRMVAELTPDYPSQYAAIGAVVKKLGIGTAETLRKWVRRAEVNAGQRGVRSPRAQTPTRWSQRRARCPRSR